MPSEKKYAAPALEKGLDILELLSEQEFGLSQTEISRALNRSVGEIFRMLVVLQERGYLMMEPGSDRYVLTTFLFEVANRTPLIRRLTALAGPLMQKLTVTTNQSAHLAILTGGNILVVGQVDSPGNNVMSVKLGARIDVWHASSGRVILAYQSRDVLHSLIEESPLPAGTSFEKIIADLDDIHRRGLEIMDSFYVGGVVNISAPIIDHSGHAIAALTTPHIKRLDANISFEQCTKELVKAAKHLSTSLGGGTARPTLDITSA
jgi:DNA-binding IclR family transcriptional regulator